MAAAVFFLEDPMKKLSSLHLQLLILGLSFSASASCRAPDTVTCSDGTTSRAGKDACSSHGGMQDTASATNSTPAPAQTLPETAAAVTKAPLAGSAPAPAPPTPQAVGAPAPASASGPTPEAALMGRSATAPAPPPVPAGATAQCKDGTYSVSKQASTTCSDHGGVKKWLNKPSP